ncbi:MAG: hypothetical protein AAF908_09755 [Pseudomonadota bacterium]
MTNMQKFVRDEAGAVTIDWVALTAGILLLGIALVYGIFNEGVDPLAGRISASLSSAAIDIDTGDAPDLNPGS